MRKKEVIEIGTKFGRLSYLHDVDPSPNGARRAFFACVCGGLVACFLGNVKKGTTKSCGCLAREITKKRSTTHGMTKTHAYICWQAMKQRCLYKKHKSYKVYGGAGITVCKRWINSFEDFIKDMGMPPSETHQIDRKDGARGYKPSNCRWATPKEQGCNRKTNRIIQIGGEKKCMAEWARIAGIDRALFRYRLEHGWTGLDLLLAPTK